MGFIYVVTDPSRVVNGHWKVGMAEDVFKRMEHFKTWSPDVYLCFCYEVSNPRFIEAQLHKILEQSGYRLDREWFRAPSIDFLLRVIFNHINSYEFNNIPVYLSPKEIDLSPQNMDDDFILSLDFSAQRFTIYEICDSLYPGYYYHFQTKEIISRISRNLEESNSIKGLLVSKQLQCEYGEITDHNILKIKELIHKALSTENVYVDITGIWPRLVKVTSKVDFDRFCLHRFRLYSLTRGRITQVLKHLCPKLLDYLYCMKPINLSRNAGGDNLHKFFSEELDSMSQSLDELGANMRVCNYPGSMITIYLGEQHVIQLIPDIQIIYPYERRQITNHISISDCYDGIRNSIDMICMNKGTRTIAAYKAFKAPTLKKICSYYGVKYTKIDDYRVFDDIVAKYGTYKSPV